MARIERRFVFDDKGELKYKDYYYEADLRPRLHLLIDKAPRDFAPALTGALKSIRAGRFNALREETRGSRSSKAFIVLFDSISTTCPSGELVKRSAVSPRPIRSFRCLRCCRIAAAALKLRDRQLASGLLGKTMRLSETVSEPASQASILLAAAAGFADFDAQGGYNALKEAVKVVNRAGAPNVDDFRILRRVRLSCQAGEDSWYGASDKAERFSLFETFARIAAADVDGALSLARDLDEPPTRIRTLIFIIRAMTQRQRRDPPATPRG